MPDTAQSKLLSASEAAARLGVKRATLYAYVSRGLLDRSVALDGRTSLFDPGQVDALRTSSRRTTRGELATVITSSITKLDESGHLYRDQPVSSLIERGLSFEQVADLIWQRDHLVSNWTLPESLRSNLLKVRADLPHMMPTLERLRVATSVASTHDELRSALSSAGFAQAGRWIMLAQSMSLLLGRQRMASGAGVAQSFWPGLIQESRRPGAAATADRVRSLEVAMILLADHGLAASTFGVRIAASVRADPYSIVATGLGSMGGALHGSAALAVVRLFERVAESGPSAVVGERLANGERIPGFGHTVYRKADPRHALLMDAIADGWPEDSRLDTVLRVTGMVMDRVEQPPNIDLALGALAWLAHFDQRVIAVFSVARTAGWIAHAVEEMAERPVRFRATARYVPNHPDPNRLDLSST